MIRMRAAGRGLTVAELREALTRTVGWTVVGVRDIGQVVAVEASMTDVALEVDTTRPTDEELSGEVLEFLEAISDGNLNLAEIRARARELVDAW